MPGSTNLSYIGRSNRKMEAHFLSMQSHIGCLRSLEESDRVKAACVRYLQNWLIYFYPERPDLVKEMEQLAASFGGQLTVPHLSWKYSWLRAIFGWSLAKRAKVFLPQIRWSFAKGWDKMLFRIESKRLV